MKSKTQNKKSTTKRQRTLPQTKKSPSQGDSFSQSKKTSPLTSDGVRINLYLAHHGITTRRGADALIKNGHVLINGKVATLGQKIFPKDEIDILHHKTTDDYVYYAYNKPTGIVTTNPHEGEKDILMTTRFPEKVFPVGRLDKDSHGLILMTNDGRITRSLLAPEHDHDKEYIVTTKGVFNDAFLPKLARGVRFDTYTTKPAKTKRLGEKTFSITLTEGKNRQIRKMVQVFYHAVADLKRVRILNIKLGTLKPGHFRKIEGQELSKLLTILAIK